MGSFGESEYATAASVELGTRWLWKPGFCWTPERVAEALLGFDGAYLPARKDIWRLLMAKRPDGVVLKPTFWEGSPHPAPSEEDLPAARVSLMLQFKCSETRAGRKGLFGASVPYFWFSVKKSTGGTDQQEVLRHLETSLDSSQALVRYAAPAFTERSDLEIHHLSRDVLSESVFVPPARMPPPHTAWAFLGPGLNGRANPNGEPEPIDTFEEVADLVAELATETATTWSEHLARVAEGARRMLVVQRDRVVEDVMSGLEGGDAALKPSTLETLRNWAYVSRAAVLAGATWRVLETSQATASDDAT